MLWPFVKILVVLAVPFGPVFYSTAQRHARDADAIERIVSDPSDTQWTATHPRQALSAKQAELRNLNELLQDLQS